MADPNSGQGYSGQADRSSEASDYNASAFMIKMMQGRMATATLVKVMAVTNAGGVEAVGTVDILPLVHQVDGAGNAVPHGTIYKCPYVRIQGGANAVILDPQVGDIGIAVFADRDISSVIANKGAANPGSRRRFDMADGLYVGGVLNGVPSQYVQFSPAGITVTSPVAVTVNAPVATVNASTSTTLNSPHTTCTGALTVQGLLTYQAGMAGSGGSGASAAINGNIIVTNGNVTADGIDLKTHVHTGVQTGSGSTGGPTG